MEPNDLDLWVKVWDDHWAVRPPEPQVESYVGPDAGFCVLGLVHKLYDVETVKRTRRQRLWNAIRYNPAQRWWNRRMHDRYCCGGYCAR